MWEAEIGRIQVPGQPGQKGRPFAKRAGGMAQMVESLLSKLEALNSTISP
jgi:hypothetical protein